MAANTYTNMVFRRWASGVAGALLIGGAWGCPDSPSDSAGLCGSSSIDASVDGPVDGSWRDEPDTSLAEAAVDDVSEEVALDVSASCRADSDCTSAAPYCVDAACGATKPLGRACVAGIECTSGSCVDGVCCGSSACPQCTTCGASGSCVPGAMGAACTTPNAASSACNAQGVCNETSCSPGFLDCDGDKINGCETPINPSNCGGCGVVCAPQNVISAVCSATSGGCTYTTCAPFDTDGNRYLDCDGNKANGCELAPEGDSNCETCGNDCSRSGDQCQAPNASTTMYHCHD